MIKKYFHEVWPAIEEELRISLETSKLNTEERRQKKKQKHVAKRKGKFDPRTNRPGKRK